MNKQGFKDTQSCVYVYQEQGSGAPDSAAVGLDVTDSNKLKIVASANPGASPIFSSVAPTVAQAGIVIDPVVAQVSIKLIPENTGTIAFYNTYGLDHGADAVLTIGIDNVIGSVIGATNTVLVGNTGAPPAFSSTPSVDSITISDAPVNPTDGTNKAYVDSISSGFTFLDAARVATTANLTATYNNGAAGVGATLTNSGAQVALTIDGVALSVNDRVLVKNQTAEAQNGIYDVTDIGSGATNWVLTRSADYDQAPAEIKPGTIVPIEEGTVNANSLWVQTQIVTTVGTDSIIFIQFGPSSSLFLLKSANLSDVASAPTSRTNLGLTNIAIQSTTNHAVIVGAPSNAITSLALGTDGQVLTGNTGADPAFANIGTKSGLTAHGVVIAEGAGAFAATTVGATGQVFIGNTGADPSWGQVSLTAGVTGVLPIANGGTNSNGSGITNINSVLIFDGTRFITITNDTAGKVLTSNGVGVLPSFQPGSGGGGGTTTTVYNTPGSFTFNKQVSTKVVEIFGWGGGGGGAGASANGGGGGGNGGCMYYKVPAAFVDSATTVIVGTGGAGGTSGGSGANGTPSVFGFMSTGDPAGTTAVNGGAANSTGGFLGTVYSSTAQGLPIAPASAGTFLWPRAGRIGTTNGDSQPSYLGSMIGTGGGSAGIAVTGGNGGSVIGATVSFPNGQPPAAGPAIILAGGTGGAAGFAGSDGNDGALVLTGFMCGGTGGGAGGPGNTAGGDGGFPGGGGGGGGRGGSTAIGGAGGDGLVIVIEYA